MPADPNATALLPCLTSAPWPTAEALVSIPEPGYPGFRIVGYRVPAENPDMMQSLFDLAKRDSEAAENARLRAVLARIAGPWEPDDEQTELSARMRQAATEGLT